MNHKYLLFFLGLLSYSCLNKNDRPVELQEDIIFEQVVKPYLKDDLWDNKNAYDAGNFLMIPLYTAFTRKEKWKQYFSEHVKRFLENKENLATGNLNRLQYLYFLSNYLKLSKKDATTNDNSQLFLIIYDALEKIWNSEAITWDRPAFNSMKARLDWKLKTPSFPNKSYYTVITDEELFVMAIAADLKTYLLIEEQNISSMLLEIISYADNIFDKRLKWDNENRCYFQAGYWTDHPDFHYAGNNEKIIGMAKKTVIDIGEDVSHSHRLPLWLLSFQDSHSKEPAIFQFYQKVRAGLTKQFIDKILVIDKAKGYILTKNFMDGTNGIYRWNYATLNTNDGYGPYELSGTFLIGWWSFLDNEKIEEAYKLITQSFPLNSELINLYSDRSTRERNSYVKNSETNDMKKLITLLASQIVL